MSIRQMSAVWRVRGLPPGPKMVLLALADIANDAGECFPGVPSLAEKCSMSERTVQEHLVALVRTQKLEREFRPGRSTLYRITDPSTWTDLFDQPPPQNSHPRRIRTPAVSAPPQISHPAGSAGEGAKSAPPPPQNSHPRSTYGRAYPPGYPSLTPGAGARDASPPADSQVPKALPTEVSVGLWDAFRAKHERHWSAPVEEMALRQLRQLAGLGADLDRVLEAATLRGQRDLVATAATLEHEGSMRLAGAPGAPSKPTIGCSPERPREADAEIRHLRELHRLEKLSPEQAARLADLDPTHLQEDAA